MMMKHGLLFVNVLLFVACAGAHGLANPSSQHLGLLEHEKGAQSLPMYKQECWMKRPLRLSFLASSAGFFKTEQLKLVNDQPKDEDGYGGGDGLSGDGDGDGFGLDGLGGDGDGDGDGDGGFDGLGPPPRKKAPPSKTPKEPPSKVMMAPPSKVAPAKAASVTVLKDGFLKVDCIKDYMYYHGDKYGAGRHAYELSDTSKASIVRYDISVAKEDRKEMTAKVCFEFCRTVPDMGFFGLINGRGCYCTPYYKPMASDSSNCDAVCPGDPVNMCGGESKSDVYEMHSCDDTGKELADAGKEALAVKADLEKAAGEVQQLSTDMQGSAAKLQVSFGKMGDSATTSLLQSAKVFAGDLAHTSEEATQIAKNLEGLEAAGKKITNFKDAKEVGKAEANVKDISKGVSSGKDTLEKLKELEELASPSKPSANASKQYYPIMYFVDKEQKDTPQTCGGDVVAKPIVGQDLDGCASACDKYPMECVGIGFYAGEKTLCFLFSKFETAFYYTGCGASAPAPAKKKFMLLQSAQVAAPFEVKCLAKFSEFDGTTLKPDPSGKCKKCLKKVTKADRCFEK